MDALKVLVFKVEKLLCALDVEQVSGVEFAAALTPLPHSPEIVAGILNYHGDIFPVIDMRKRFGLEPKELELKDRFLVCSSKCQSYILWVDDIEGTVEEIELDTDNAQAGLLKKLPFVKGLGQLNDEILYISDLDTFLNFEESTQLENALKGVSVE